MSVIVSRWVWEHSTASGNDLIIELKIADNANDDGGGAYPGVDYLARAARISKRAAYDCLKRLKKSGEIWEERPGGGKGRRTVYRVLMGQPAPAAEDADEAPANGEDAAPYDAPKDEDPAPYADDDTVQPAAQTVQPAAQYGAARRVRSIEEPSLNRPKNHPRRREDKNSQERPEVDALCVRLAERIIGNGHNRLKFTAKAKTQRWRTDMRRLLDVDLAHDANGNPIPLQERVARAERAIDWCQADDFWGGVVFSPANLRANIERIRKKATQQRNGNGVRPPVDVSAQVEALRNTDPTRRLGQDYTEEQAAELKRLTEQEWAGRQVLGRRTEESTP